MPQGWLQRLKVQAERALARGRRPAAAGLLAVCLLAVAGWLTEGGLSAPAGAHVPTGTALASATTTGMGTTTTGTGTTTTGTGTTTTGTGTTTTGTGSTTTGTGSTTTGTGTPPAPRGPSHWVTSWGAATQGPSPASPMAQSGFRNATLRQSVFLTSGGSEVRVRFSNIFGRRPLRIGLATAGIQSSGATVQPGTMRRLRFDGRTSVVIPPGYERLSDPVRLGVRGLHQLLISAYLPGPTGPATLQSDSRELSYAAHGSRALQRQGAGFRQKLYSWYFLSGVLTLSPPRDIGSVVAIGDSITAGVGSAVGANANWPDDLARRLNRLPGATLSVVDEGIGGNRVLNDAPCCGVSAVSRFGLNVVRQTGVRTVILLEGVNDLGFSQKRGALSAPHSNVSAAQIISGYRQIIAQAHAHGLRIIGCTLTPFEGARYWNPAAERKREAVNSWILTSGAFNGVINFAAVLGEPGDPERLNPGYDSGDHLHPNDAGYRAMADAIQLSLLFPRR
ncbi:MAG TPA: SGNH/GDSL hydrolase family protein [Solirubrobacteraceae bacterium]|nr:SGNH/GDSL hydrolase family protein [Solirubrobacteraceae bacterium]